MSFKGSFRLTGIAALAVAASLVTAGSVNADSWLGNPNNCTGAATATERVVSGRTVQVRHGDCNGTHHGWGRILGYGSSDYIRFEVDINGDRVPDGYSSYRAETRNYTAGYPTSSSSDRAFRACFSSNPCTSANATAWW